MRSFSDNRWKDNSWKYVFPALSVIFWIATVVLFIRSTGVISNYETELQVLTAVRWLPACFIGAVFSTAAAYVVEEIHRIFDV